MTTTVPQLDISKNQNVINARQRLADTQQQLSAAEATAVALSKELEAHTDRTLKVEALAELGERSVEDAKTARATLEKLRTNVAAANDDVKRKKFAIEHLEEKLADVETAALEQIQQWIRSELETRIKTFGKKLLEASAASQKIEELHILMRDNRIQPPHDTLAWFALRPSGRAYDYRMWRGDYRNGPSELEQWQKDAAEHGYSVK